MKKKIIIALAAFLVSVSYSVAQEGLVQYKVNKGDTVSKIAREYGVSVADVLNYNPDAKNGIKEGGVLSIPTKAFLAKDKKSSSSTQQNKANNTSSSASGKTYTIKSKDTLYGISKEFKVSVDNLHKWNPDLKDSDLKVGTVINLSAPAKSSTESTKKENPKQTTDSSVKEIKTTAESYITIEVEPKQTLYAIASKYNTTVKKIQELNPDITADLSIGQQIKVPVSGSTKGNSSTAKTETKKNGVIPTSIIVEPKQTLYSISKEYGVSVDDLIRANPEVIEKGVVVGMELLLSKGKGTTEAVGEVKPPVTNNVSENKPDKEVVVEEEKSTPFIVDKTPGYTDLTRTLDKSKRKELTLLLPFNINRVGDNVDTKVKNDPFLNMTLDFYSGALLAIEQANKLGLELTVNVYDSDESKNSSSVSSLFKEKDFSKTDVIIGPFFQNNVDQAVKALPNKKIVLVSPLSNEKASPSSQLVQTMPYGDVLRKTFIEYFLRQNAKITVIVDDKKASTKKFMSSYFPNIKVISTSAINDVDRTLTSGSKNVFIIDSNSIVSTTHLITKLKGRVRDYDIQVASFDKSEAFDYGEISIESLVALKYTFPSVTRETESQTESLFAQEFKSKYNITPNRFATRGYDVTLDVILRMFQEGNFISTLGQKTQETENKFIFGKNTEGTIRNSGIYILQYNDDLTVKVLE
ncbi:MAG: LysM peptidoglycan-binding domain-containing protein [Flavobacteriaceae bacterium]|jgi:LysM repeat protein|nr:LysM peptidoglycan-binding domain-containing protein [Flavobacteriaceae bacterium]